MVRILDAVARREPYGLARVSVGNIKTLTMCGLAGCLLLIGGWAITANQIKLFALAVLLLAVAAAAISQRGLLIGFFVLAAMDGIPFIDTSKYVASKLTLEDVAVIAFLCTALLWHLMDPKSHPTTRMAQILSRLAVIPFIWWVFVLGHTLSSQHVPIIHAVSFGREYLFFALLLAIVPRIWLTSRDIWSLLAVLAAGVSVFAVGQIMTAIGHPPTGGLIHVERTLEQSGLTRVYAHMTDLVSAGVALGLAACFLAPQRVVRRLAYPLTALLLVSVAVQQTRARWVGLIVGIFVVCLWLMVSADGQVALKVRKRVATSLWVFGLGFAAIALVAPSASNGVLGQRFLSTLTDVETGGGSLSVREAVSKTMFEYLGAKWPVGLGFVPPSTHYFQGLPMGSIKDSDVGVLNALVTVGAIGAFLVLLPIVLTLFASLRRSAASQASAFTWLRYGGSLWIAGALVSSITLVTFFSPSGLVLTAIVITLLAHPQVAVLPASPRVVRLPARYSATAEM
jgi:hypothetical protein